MASVLVSRLPALRSYNLSTYDFLVVLLVRGGIDGTWRIDRMAVVRTDKETMTHLTAHEIGRKYVEHPQNEGMSYISEMFC